MFSHVLNYFESLLMYFNIVRSCSNGHLW